VTPVSRVKEFNLPDLGEGLTEGEILKWLVNVGDTVALNQPIVEVETAKAAVEIPAKWAGQIVTIFHAEGETVEVGSPIIAIDTEPGAGPLPESGPVPSEASLAAVELAPAEGAIEPGLIGGPAPGGRTAVLVGYGPRSTTAKRRPRTTGPATSQPAARQPAAPQPAAVAVQTRPAPAPVVVEPEPVAARPAAGVLAKPPVRKLAKDLGVDLTQLVGTGPQGSISRDDVQAAAAAPTAAQLVEAASGKRSTAAQLVEAASGKRSTAAQLVEAASGKRSSAAQLVEAASGKRSSAAAPAARLAGEREWRVAVKGVRKLTAENMVASAFAAPHVSEFYTVDVTRSVRALERLRAMPDWQDVRVSPLLLVAKAVLLAVRRHPMVNSSWAGDEIIVKDYVNLGIAAATERGLIVPNIKDAGMLSLRELADAMTALVQTAKAGRTSPADMAGGTFTITNVGVFGVDTGTPILPPGEAAILALGSIREQPWVHRGRVRVRQVTTLGISFDHRIIDGELGSRFLHDVGTFLSDPEAALLAWG
jgi:pyruvate dehydrogenase E2 component (dihydrolipoamide acetyltransferase)